MVTHPSLQNAGPRLRYLMNRFIEDRLNANAAALTFVSLFALVPLLTVTLSIASALPAAGDIEAKLSDFLLQFLLPESSTQVVQYLSTFIDQARFMTPEWLMEHADKKINEIVIEYSHHDEINRPVVEHSFEQLQGKMSSFSFMMLAPDQIARRARSCWCAACFNQLGRATLEPKGNELICTSCSSPFPLPWHEMTVKDLGMQVLLGAERRHRIWARSSRRC